MESKNIKLTKISSISKTDIIQLPAHAEYKNIDTIKTENLYVFDGRQAYSFGGTVSKFSLTYKNRNMVPSRIALNTIFYISLIASCIIMSSQLDSILTNTLLASTAVVTSLLLIKNLSKSQAQ